MKLVGEGITVRCRQAPSQREQPGGNEPVACHDDEYPVDDQPVDDQPVAFFWRGRLYRVQVIQGRWRWCGAWWTTPTLAGRERVYYRLLCAMPGGPETSVEIYREEGQWTLSRLLD